MQRIRLKVTIRLLTPLHVGGDTGSEVNISYILRDANKKAYYPGTAFKGKVRHYARSLQQESCAFPQPCNCIVCRLFGWEGNARGSLFFENFYAVTEQFSDFRAGNSIDRLRRVAEDEKLFVIESAAIQELVGYITGNIEESDIRLLEQSIKLVRQIGGNTSRGFGWVDGEIMIHWEETEPEKAEADSLEIKDIIPPGTDSVSLTLIPKTPLLIGTHTTQSNFRDTQQVIPGAVVRAALARAICEQDGTGDPSPEGIKNDLPGNRGTFFPHLRHSFGELRISVLNAAEPFPMTMQRCKFEPDHEPVDVLAAMLRGEIAKCPVCGERLEKEVPPPLPTVTSTHSEIDRRRGIARDGRLYSLRAIAPGKVRFQGTINGISDWTEFKRLFEPSLRVGGMLTTGFGECIASFEPIKTAKPEQESEDMLRRIRAFNKLAGNQDIFVPITLMSDTFTDLKEPEDGDYLQAYSGLTKPFEVVKVIAKNRIWRGFDTGKKEKGFEKQARTVLKAGSVLVLKVTTLDAETLQILGGFARQGIGADTMDGYGEVRIVHEAHLNFYNQFKEDDDND